MATIDTSLHAATSGAAAVLAASHAQENPLKLHGGWFCPFVQRAWIVLVEKRIPHQYVEINPYKKAPEFLALNPRGLVPTLEVPVVSAGSGGGGAAEKKKALYESNVICEFLEEAFSDGDDGLLPPFKDQEPSTTTYYEKARCRLWIDHINTKIIPGFYRLLQHTPDKSDYSIESARDNLRDQIGKFVREMLEQEQGKETETGAGPWFLGDRFSLVDVMLAPWAKRLFLIDHYKPGGLGIPPPQGDMGDGDDEKIVWERWQRWLAAITQRPSVLETWSDDEMYIEAYKRYAEDTTQSEVGQATRKGGRLP